MTYEIFALEMRSLKSYKESAEDIERQIDDIVYQYAGVRGISYDKQRVSFSENVLEEQRQRLYEALNEPQRELDFTVHAIQQLEPRVNKHLASLPEDVREASILLFWKGWTYEELGKKYGYSDSGMRYRMMKEVARI